jgi:DNA-binding HxlR family transcriptional regulator
VSETKKMQTVPEWYEFPCSDTAAQKMLGNGWTIEVIVHLIRATQVGKTEAKQLTFWEV